MPLLVRVPGNDWVERGWFLAHAAILGLELAKRGVDLLDVSTG